jgi:hypothetical protein
MSAGSSGSLAQWHGLGVIAALRPGAGGDIGGHLDRPAPAVSFLFNELVLEAASTDGRISCRLVAVEKSSSDPGVGDLHSGQRVQADGPARGRADRPLPTCWPRSVPWPGSPTGNRSAH